MNNFATLILSIAALMSTQSSIATTNTKSSFWRFFRGVDPIEARNQMSGKQAHHRTHSETSVNGPVTISEVVVNGDEDDVKFLKENSTFRRINERLRSKSMQRDEFEWNIGLMRVLPGMSLQFATQPMGDGKTRLIISAKRSLGKMILSGYNNSNRRFGDSTFAVLTEFANPVGFNDVILVDASTTEKSRRLSSLTAGYIKQLGSHGTSISAFFSNLTYNAEHGQIRDNRFRRYNAQVRQYFHISNMASTSVDVGVTSYDLINATERPLTGGIDEIYKYSVIYAKVRAQCADTRRSLNTLEVGYTTNLKDPRVKSGRPRFENDFGVVDVRLSRTQQITDSLQLIGKASVTYSNDALPPIQQLAIGNVSAGRGYRAGLLSANRGVAASLELRYDHKFAGNRLVNSVSPYAFLDVVGFSRPDRSINKEQLGSGGIGFIAQLPYKIAFTTEMGVPFASGLIVDGESMTRKANWSFKLVKTIDF